MVKVGANVERYYATAQMVVAVERVTLQPLRTDFSPVGFARRLEFEMRIEWTPGEDGGPGAATLRRHLTKVHGRAPRANDKLGCSDPRSLSPDPLGMLLPHRSGDFVFTLVRMGQVGRRAAMMVDYRSITKGEIRSSWHDDCVSVELPGRSSGRLWIDPETGGVLRMDEHLVGKFDISVPFENQRKGVAARLTVERADTSTRYEEVTFLNPKETLMMPLEVDTIQMIRGAGSGMRIHRVLTGFRRFATEGLLRGN